MRPTQILTAEDNVPPEAHSSCHSSSWREFSAPPHHNQEQWCHLTPESKHMEPLFNKTIRRFFKSLTCWLIYLSGYNLGSGNVAHVGHSNEVPKRGHPVRTCERKTPQVSMLEVNHLIQVFYSDSSFLTSRPGISCGQRGEILHHVIHHAHFSFILSQRNANCSSFKRNVGKMCV